MRRFFCKTDPGPALRIVLLAQIAMAGLLVAIGVIGEIPVRFGHRVDLPSTPVSPGDQRRRYRTDRTDPALVILEDQPDLPLAEEFPDRLTFSEITLEGFGKVLLLSGQIATDDAKRFQEALSDMADKPDVVALHSPGGLVFEALRLGRALREQGLTTAVLSGAFYCPVVPTYWPQAWIGSFR